MIFSDSKKYKIVKYISSILIPALGALYAGLAMVWHLPYGEEVGSTVLVVTTFLNTLMGISSERYDKLNKDEIVDEVISDDEG